MSERTACRWRLCFLKAKQFKRAAVSYRDHVVAIVAIRKPCACRCSKHANLPLQSKDQKHAKQGTKPRPHAGKSRVRIREYSWIRHHATANASGTTSTACNGIEYGTMRARDSSLYTKENHTKPHKTTQKQQQIRVTLTSETAKKLKVSHNGDKHEKT